MRRIRIRWRRRSLVGLLAGLALLAAGCGDDNGPTTKATCWTPEFAANPMDENGKPLLWARDPSPTHRHGAGPVGSDVCGP